VVPYGTAKRFQGDCEGIIFPRLFVRDISPKDLWLIRKSATSRYLAKIDCEAFQLAPRHKGDQVFRVPDFQHYELVPNRKDHKHLSQDLRLLLHVR